MRLPSDIALPSGPVKARSATDEGGSEARIAATVPIAALSSSFAVSVRLAQAASATTWASLPDGRSFTYTATAPTSTPARTASANILVSLRRDGFSASSCSGIPNS